jgi:hypothetical protein
VRLPNSEKSRAVVVGTSTYQPNLGFESLPAVTKNLDDITTFLREQTGLTHVTVIKDPTDNAAIIDAIRPAAQEAEDLLLFYYAGHGVPLASDVGLTVTTSRSDGASWSTLHYADVRREIRATSAAIKIVILDSCHSGRAFGSEVMADTDQNEILQDLAEIEGAYVLTATNSTQKFAAAAGVHGCTAFTGAFLEVLRDGIDSDDEYFTMAAVFQRLARKLRAAGNPVPKSSGSNSAARIALTRNSLRNPAIRAGSLSHHCDKILDLASPFPRYAVVGAAGTGKSALMQRLSQRCRNRDLLPLEIVAPRYDTAKKPVLADIDACAKLLSELIGSIKEFERQRAGSTAVTSAAKDALGRACNPNVWYHLVTDATSRIDVNQATDSTIVGGQLVADGKPVDQSTILDIIQRNTLDALAGLATDHPLVVLVDDVDRLDGTPLAGWLRGLLKQLPAYRTVTFRRPGNDSWRQHPDDAEDTITLLDMSSAEVVEYVKEQGLTFTDEVAGGLIGVTRGRPVAVAAWCGLALNSGANQFAGLEDVLRSGVYDKGFTRLTGCIQLAIDQIAADVLGYQVPLFGLLTIAERVTPGLIGMLEGDDGRKPSEAEADRIYQLLAQRPQLFSPVDPMVEESVSLPRAIRDVTWNQLRHDRKRFRALQSSAERYERNRVGVGGELSPQEKEKEPFAEWRRFEQITWIRSVESWINHIEWLGPDDFKAVKPALVKLYLDAFWWWDDYLRSKATSDIGTWLKKVLARQGHEPWMDLIERFSDNWVSSWDEAELRAEPEKWKSVLRAITGLLGTFGLKYDHIPADMPRRRIYILLCNFYGKALWYAGSGSRKDADEADEWLAAAYRACQTQPGEDDEQNPNGWIGSWAQLRRAEIWALLDRKRAIGYLVGLDQAAINDDDDDLRVGVAMLVGDLWWLSGDYAKAIEVYSHAVLVSYTYNSNQEKMRQAPNLYTKSLYASTIRRAQAQISQAEQDGDPAVLTEIDTALAAVRELFQPYWEEVALRPDAPPEPTRFELPVPPPWPGDVLEIESQYFSDLEYVAMRLARISVKPIDPPHGDLPNGRKSH